MCNLYRQRSGPQAILDAAKSMRSTVGNLARGDVYPDYPAPIVRWEAFHASAVFFGDFFVLPGEQLLQQLGML